jgi:hypothetical protein
MDNEILDTLTTLPDAVLVARVKTLVGRDREVTAELIAHLAEMDTREIHLREGYRSLYVYCRDALGLAEWEAYHRIDAARTAQRFPVILQMLARGSINLTTIRLLGPHLTPANHLAVLEQAQGKRKAEVEEIVARLAPRPDVAASVRRLPSQVLPGPVPAERAPTGECADLQPASSATVAARLTIPTTVTVAPQAASPTAATPASSPASSAVPSAVTALSPDRYKLQLTIGGETLEKLRLAQDMLAHTLPSADYAAVVDRALTVLLADLARKKFADTSRPRPAGQRKPGARSPSAAVKRVVWVRDLGRCAFVGAGGHRCGERRFVEFHHVDPYALGGEATVEGIQLRCRQHNSYEGRLYFGTRRRGRELAREHVRPGPGSGSVRQVRATRDPS